FVYTSGQLPLVDGALPMTGKVGAEVSGEDAAGLARIAALNGLAAVDALVGLDAVAGIVKVVGYVASAPGFTGQPAVINGASALGAGEAGAGALVGGAVRETFEETGVLLTVPRADLSGARADVERGLVSFGDLLRANGLAVDAAALRPWSRWVTPAGEVRRY